ncbi:ATP-binding cassette domain-containing protein [Oceanobacillus profundus]|uniref:ATP-binding cassette domain-containing protein n=1 Tax=Oceanobacillus profundus TaxID=372463 RepID=A0A417YIJ5_9BACI|nr:ATP-binding cassette domain-containing protein [Oceanobacillus profundus]MCM3400112.1 ATP-binding cassette domain-containing protein [Oceanobacillus profundus]MDO6449881.1 ATP-binding cassette domain-containing protein [Oceanobacillus profundus]PAE28296.1 methionine ABC transporter ATP-binding protein [Paenibacillus sp. 7884-2]RHW32672.1 ATP-binding cassette domain-containing protein [Oceanobacillus profundus]
MIKLENITKVFPSKNGDVTAVNNVNLHVKKGEIHGVIGYSGAGKSTLIRLVNLLEKPTNGSVSINGTELTSLPPEKLRKTRQKVGMIFQHFNLLKTATVYDNIATPLKLLGYDKQEVKKRVEKYLKIVDLAEKQNSYPSQLSGGQKQRVAIARALSQEPEILLSDEATSALDPETTNSILDLLLKINEDLGITILLITHEMNVIQKICDYVYVLEKGEVIEQSSSIELFTNPRKHTTKKFLDTISQRKLSASLISQLKLNGTVTRLTFIGENTGQPLLSQVSQKFNVEPNILTANIMELKNGIVGNLVIHLVGEPEQINASLQFLNEQGVATEEVEGE